MNEKKIVKSSATKTHIFYGDHRYEHWYVDNQVYFITARCRDRYPAFASAEAQRIFWDRFEHYAKENEFFPWVVSLVGNHYHVLGYCRSGRAFGEMMRKVHGSVAKLVNDLLPERHVPFWREAGNQDYFDGCIRDEKQCRKAYRYTLTQCRRHGFCDDWRTFPGTRVYIELDAGVKRAIELHAFMEDVPYERYRKGKMRREQRSP
ncbi:MAG: hypothetical protein NT031_09080 [Planctomycetota bacterium]|nr:hypothetical protein [Planctomycetota bacterium]